MRAVAKSFDEKFAVRLTVGNPYETPQTFEIKAYDENYKEIEADISKPRLRIPANETRAVTVIVSFAGATQRKVRVCAEGIFMGQASAEAQIRARGQSAVIRTQVCGKYLGKHFGAP